MGLVANSGTAGAYLLATLRAASEDHLHVAEVRGEGLHCAVKFAQDRVPLHFFDPAGKTGPAIGAAMARRDVIARATPDCARAAASHPVSAVRAPKSSHALRRCALRRRGVMRRYRRPERVMIRLRLQQRSAGMPRIVLLWKQSVRSSAEDRPSGLRLAVTTKKGAPTGTPFPSHLRSYQIAFWPICSAM